MNRLWMIVVAVGVLTVSAFAQVEGQEDAQGAAPVEQAPIQRNQAQQIQRGIIDLYLSDFRQEVELSEDQFLALAPEIRRFIQLQFRAANRRRELSERQNQLLRQPNLSEVDVQRLNEEQAKLDSEAGTMEAQLIRRIRSKLTDRQVLLVRPFNMRFFKERLPALIEKARAQAATPRGQRPQRPETIERRNPIPTRDQTRPRNTFERPR